MKKPLFCLLSLLIFTACEEKNSKEETPDIEGLVWSDEFNGDDWDEGTWYPELGANGWGNNEWQNYTPFRDNLSVSDGTLKITAELVGQGQRVGDYTSARLLSRESFLYGRIEVRAKLPEHQGNGLWPAIWMLGDTLRNGGSWPACGELDLMEYVSFDPNKVHASIHSTDNNHRNGTQLTSGSVHLETAEEEFHIYGLIWDERFLAFYIDEPDNVILQFNRPQNYDNDNWPFDKPHFFILNIAVGGDWGGLQGVDDSIFPATMEIDYVRVFEN